jgi:hypothetical protein
MSVANHPSLVAKERVLENNWFAESMFLLGFTGWNMYLM